MRKIYLIITVFLLVFISCDNNIDILDREVSTGLTEDEVFKEAQYAERYLYDIYDQLIPVLPIGPLAGSRWRSPDVYLEASTDNGHAEAQWGNVHNFNNGAWDAAGGSFSNIDWNMYWKSIRALNNFIARIDEVPNNANFAFDDDKRALRKAEAMTLLAWNYAELAKEFGGVPLILKYYSIEDKDDMNRPRNTYDETVNLICELCDEAAKVLPVDYPSANDYGRVTKGAALAIKARTLLYAASPLWNNPDKPLDSPFRGEYSQEKWKLAAEAAAEVIMLNKYVLMDDITKIFLTRVNDEFIFTRMNRRVSYTTGLSVPNKLYINAYGNGGMNQVTYNMIKQYEYLKNDQAYDIEDPASGYDPDNPYVARDPRFYRDCLYNGANLKDLNNQIAEFGISADGKTPKGKHNDPYEGPMDTYVYSVKFADTHLYITWNPSFAYRGQAVDANYPYIRYAQVLLDYAEAMNEYFGPEVDGLGNGLTALWAVNQVRTRSRYPIDLNKYKEYLPPADGTQGMPPLPTGMSQEEMRSKLRRERRVELSYEEHRFWDVRRWKLDPEEFNTIQAQIPEWYTEDGVRKVRYKIVTTQKRVFHPKMYRMPIPEDQIFANPNLIQNPGWPFSPESEE